MKAERLASMISTGIAADSETWRIQHGNNAPPVVCGSVGWLDRTAYAWLLAARDARLSGRDAEAEALENNVRERLGGSMRPMRGAFLTKEQAADIFRELITERKRVIIGANLQFDLLVMAVHWARLNVDLMPEIFALLADDGVFDIQFAEMLHAIANGNLGKDPRTGTKLVNPETKKPGGYSLATCVDLVLGRTDAKANDEYRLRYHELDGVPYEFWPPQAKDYPVDDGRNTAETGLAQAGHLPKVSHAHRWGPPSVGPDGLMNQGACLDCGTASLTSTCLVTRPHRNLHDLARQTRAAWAMYLAASWGFHVDQNVVDVIERDAQATAEKGIKPFVEAGIIRPDGTENRSNMKRRIAAAYGSTETCPVCQGSGKVPSPVNPKSKINCFLLAEDGETRLKTCDGTGYVLSEDTPRSDGEGVSYGGDTLHESGDDLLMMLGDYTEDRKTLSVYVPYLRRARIPVAGHGLECPVLTQTEDAKKIPRCTCPGPYRDVPLILKPNPILETGRAAYRGSIQQFPRWPGYKSPVTGEWVPSLREAICARKNWLLSSTDFEAGELVTHGQSCIWITGSSNLAVALVNKVKPHNALGATMIGMSYEEFERLLKKDPRCKKARQTAKPPNFGYPGGMGPVKLVHQQRKGDVDTPCERGPQMIRLEDGSEVRGYKGLRFCIMMDGAEACGIRKVTSWNDRKIPPTCEHCIECAARLKQVWLRQWPENQAYFKFVTDCCDNGMLVTPAMLRRWPHLEGVFFPGQRLAPGEIIQHRTGRIRGGLEFCECANGFFQGLLADIAKDALFRVSRECYDRTVRVPDMMYVNSKKSAYAGGTSPLFGSRVILFAHDELIVEHPEAMAHDGAMRVSEIMVEEMRLYCPDLAPACNAEPALMRRWSKAAAPRWLQGGDKCKGPGDTLIPWDDAA